MKDSTVGDSAPINPFTLEKLDSASAEAIWLALVFPALRSAISLSMSAAKRSGDGFKGRPVCATAKSGAQRRMMRRTASSLDVIFLVPLSRSRDRPTGLAHDIYIKGHRARSMSLLSPALG